MSVVIAWKYFVAMFLMECLYKELCVGRKMGLRKNLGVVIKEKPNSRSVEEMCEQNWVSL